jgi:Fe-S-cluster containining protein
MTNQYKIINVNLTSVSSDEVLVDVPCGTCTMCCEKLSPFLLPEEIASGLYPLSLINPSPEQLRENPQAGPVVVLYRKKEGGCGMLIDKRCSIYEHRPKSCRQFDCRKGHHLAIPDMTNNINKST